MSKTQEGAQGDSIEGYKLPVTDTQKQRRNFEGFKKNTYYNLEDLKTGNDNVIDTASDKHRAKMRPFKSSSPHKAEN